MDPAAELDLPAPLRAELRDLRDRDRHLRIAMEASRVVAYQWDIAGDRVTRMRGSSRPGEALEDAGGFEDVVAKVLPEDRAAFRADIAAALASREGGYRTEVRYLRADGEVRWLLETGQVVRDADGKPARIVGISYDITDRRNAEEALRSAQEQLREQAERKDEFLAMLAHELRNPLAPIRNAVQILRLLGPPDRAAGDARDIIERQVGHLVRLVDDLLDVSRVSRGKITLQKADIDLRDVARHALDVSRPLVESRGHAIEVSLPPHAVPVHGDFTRLAQVLSNLVNNAAKYTDAGGRLELTLETRHGFACACVRDNGRGIEPGHLERIFELFYQAERDLDRAEGGLGLGLSLVKSLVELHGGSVEATSSGRGQGSAFHVRLPLRAAEAIPASGASRAGRSGPTHCLRVLVVDDLRDSALTMAQLLRLQGHDVQVAFDGREAVALALRARPDLVLLDIGLPALNGYQACRAMREGGLTDALIAAVTGYGQDEDRRLSQVAGFDAHLVKPVEPDDIQALVERHRARGR
ncbi:MAG TPA: ATP-binding protein [Usitatibacter sp.]|nr:ATP-binding protein [Usitatibacter sp.]